MKYRKKPVIIDAVQYDGTDESYFELLQFTKGDLIWHKELNCPLIETFEGTIAVSNNDYVVKDIKGKFYPWNPDIFETTYKAVN